MPQAAAQHDPALAGQPAAPSNAVPAAAPDLSALGLGREQILSLLSNLPVFKVCSYFFGHLLALGSFYLSFSAEDTDTILVAPCIPHVIVVITPPTSTPFLM